MSAAPSRDQGSPARDQLPRRVDASMDVLNNIFRQPVDPDYAAAPASEHRRKPRWWLVTAVLATFGLMVGTALVATQRGAAQTRLERDQLVSRVQAAEKRQDDLRARAVALAEESRKLRDELKPKAQNPSDDNAVEGLEVAAGARPVIGDGIIIVVDDGTGDDRSARVVDVDLRQAVNGLWYAGAEAIAINGHRLSSRTSIRSAGDAITVDYRSLTRPYRIEAIGDPQQLAVRFTQSPGGTWWTYLKQNFGIRYEVSRATDLRLEADPGLGVRVAKPR